MDGSRGGCRSSAPLAFEASSKQHLRADRVDLTKAWLRKIPPSLPALYALTSLSFICKNSHGATWTTTKESEQTLGEDVVENFLFGVVARTQQCNH
jgi:hypothetical protein